MKNFSDTIGNRTRDLQGCSAVPQLTAPQRAPPPCTRYRTVNSNFLAREKVSFFEQVPTFRRVTCLRPQSQAVYVAVLRTNQDILTVQAMLPYVCKSSPNDAASQPKRLCISDFTERNSNLARKRLSNSFLLARLAVGQETLCSVSTHSSDESITRTMKEISHPKPKIANLRVNRPFHQSSRNNRSQHNEIFNL